MSPIKLVWHGQKTDGEYTKLDAHLSSHTVQSSSFIHPLIKTIISRQVNMFVHALARAKIKTPQKAKQPSPLARQTSIFKAKKN